METPAVKQKHSRQEAWLWPSRCFILSLDSEVSEGDKNIMSIHTLINMVTKELANTLVDIFSKLQFVGVVVEKLRSRVPRAH